MAGDESGFPEGGRRKLLSALCGVGSAVYGALLLGPSVPFLSSQRAASGERWIRVAQLERLKEGPPERVRIHVEERDAFTITRGQTLGSVWLFRQGDTVRALSAECPHLGCAVALQPEGTSFGCPCHTSRFALDGKAESGPSPRAMDELATRVIEGWVEVDFRRYRQGVADKVPV